MMYDDQGEEIAAPDITLEEFEARLKRDAEAFFEKWRLSHEAEPENWPLSMGLSDWLEQFLCDISD